MAGFMIEAEIELLRDRHPELRKNLRVKRVLEDENQLLVGLGPTATFLLSHCPNYPESNTPLTAYSEDETLSDWNMHMMEYSEKKNITLEQLLLEALKKYHLCGCNRDAASSRPHEESDTDEEEEGQDDDQSVVPIKKTDQPRKPEATAVNYKSEDFFTGTGSKPATDRLIKDLNALVRSNSSSFGYSAYPIGDNLYHWEVKLFGFDSKSGLAKDLASLKSKGKSEDFVRLEMKFPAEYPFMPPFIRVVRPRFQFHTGHVTIGGSICMQLLTRTGWLPSNDIESILVQIRTEMVLGNARLDFSNTCEYTESEARQAFERVARQHNWM